MPSLPFSLPLSLFLFPFHCLFVVCGEHLERHLSFNCLRIGLIIARALFLCWRCPAACTPLTPTSPLTPSLPSFHTFAHLFIFTPTAHFQFDPVASGNTSSPFTSSSSFSCYFCSFSFLHYFLFHPCGLICPAASCLCILNCCSCSHFHFFRCYSSVHALYSLKK